MNVTAKCFTFPGVEQDKFPLGLSSNVSTRAALWAVALLWSTLCHRPACFLLLGRQDAGQILTSLAELMLSSLQPITFVYILLELLFCRSNRYLLVSVSFSCVSYPSCRHSHTVDLGWEGWESSIQALAGFAFETREGPNQQLICFFPMSCPHKTRKQWRKNRAV